MPLWTDQKNKAGTQPGSKKRHSMGQRNEQLCRK